MTKKKLRIFWLIVGSIMVLAMLLFTILPGLQSSGTHVPL